MSWPTYRQEAIAAKAARLGITDQRPLPGKNKRPRPVVLQYRDRTKWRRWSEYRNIREAQEAMAQLQRKYWFYTFRILE